MKPYIAFATGYYDGRAIGVYNNPYEMIIVSPELSYLYRQGYDRGVADYCESDEEPSEE